MIAESYERIHRSNLLMMGILPLQYRDGENAESLGLTGRETFSIHGIENAEASEVTVRADDKEFTARVRLDTPRERDYLRHGGILPYVLRRLLGVAHNRPPWRPAGAVSSTPGSRSRPSSRSTRVLQRIVETAAELTGARYAALGVIDRVRRGARALPDHRDRRRRPTSGSATCRAAAGSSAC